MSASGIRNISEANFPTNGSPGQKLGFALKYAMRAPTEHHWQAWEFRLADNYVELIASRNPELEANDPDGRETIIGCGVSLSFLKLALKHFGCLGRVELFPDLDEPALLARVYAGSIGEREAQDTLLFEAMPGHGASQSLLRDTPISEASLEALSCAVAGEKAWLEFPQNEAWRRRLLDLSVADQTQDARYHGGSVRFGPTADELPRGRFSRWTRPLLAFTVRGGGSGELFVEPAREPVTPCAALAVLKTKTDDKHGWLAAGQAAGRVVLRAEALGLSWSFLNQAVRHRQGRGELRTSVGHKGFAQAILRFGLLALAEHTRATASGTVTATLQ